MEAIGGADGPGPLIAAKPQGLYGVLAPLAEGVGEHPEGAAHIGFQPPLVLRDLVYAQGPADGVEAAVI